MWIKSYWDLVLPDEDKLGRLTGTFSLVAAGIAGATGAGLKFAANDQRVAACETQLAKGQGCSAQEIKDYTADQVSAPLMAMAVLVGGAGVMLRKLTR